MVNVGEKPPTLRTATAAGRVLVNRETFELIRRVNDTVRVTNTKGENVLIYYDDFDYLRRVYQEGLEGK